MSIRIIVVDDHRIMREGLCAMLKAEDDIEVIAEADDGREATRLAQELAPDVIIIDIVMPGLNGIDATRQIKLNAPNVRILALSMHSDKRLVREALKAGVSGYLLKDCAFDELSRAVRVVAAGRTYLSPSIAGVVVEEYLNSQAPRFREAKPPLTSREREVLQLLAEGRTMKDIGSSLQLSVKTIETHRMRIMSKLNIRSIAELTKYAVREGISPLNS